jgi:hypothetical protein
MSKSIRPSYEKCGKVIIKLPHKITIDLGDKKGSGMITMGEMEGLKVDSQAYSAMSCLGAMILAHACADIDVQSSEYLEGITAAMDEIENCYT